ncbi:hypothetical protein QBC44DRAFT_383188 [Cladorrhinum sp. PSN332]|nr:hypothetical protein QBC44DRAFT_383188 [Cladorrhinum sp. PSN332]
MANKEIDNFRYAYGQIPAAADDYQSWVRNNPATMVEEANLEAALKPHIKGSRVLDLSCGTGYYTRRALEWGAKRVVGVDTNIKAINTANSLSKNYDPNKIQFRVGNVSTLGRFSWDFTLPSSSSSSSSSSPEPNIPQEKGGEGEFDVVIGV